AAARKSPACCPAPKSPPRRVPPPTGCSRPRVRSPSSPFIWGDAPSYGAEGSWAPSRLRLMTPPSADDADTSPYEWGGTRLRAMSKAAKVVASIAVDDLTQRQAKAE